MVLVLPVYVKVSTEQSSEPEPVQFFCFECSLGEEDNCGFVCLECLFSCSHKTSQGSFPGQLRMTAPVKGMSAPAVGAHRVVAENRNCFPGSSHALTLGERPSAVHRAK